MNLRILKKLSKRAAPLLPLLGDDRDQFPAEKGESYTSTGGHDRKHWQRTPSVHDSVYRGLIKYRPKHGNGWVAMREPQHPLRGTPMVGEMLGYYEPEWDEETAWEALLKIIQNHFTTWDEGGPTWIGARLDTPTRIFRAAHEIIRASRESIE